MKSNTLEEVLRRGDKKQEMILDFVEMMLEANIPLHKRDKMSKWLMKYVPNSGFIPSSGTLRRDYLPKILKKKKLEIKDKITGQPISVIIDSSPDRLARNVVNTIFVCGFTGEKFLVDTRFLDSVNNVTLFHAIDAIRLEYGVAWEQLSTLVCDSAAYNKKLYKTIRDGINPNIKLMRCWTHLLDLVSDIWQDSPLNSKVHILTAKFQQLMNKTGSRKARYVESLRNKGAPSIKGMPTIVLSRWNTWYSAVEYLSDYFNYMFDFLKTEKKDYENSEIVNGLLELLNNNNDLSEIKLMIAFNTQRAKVFFDIIKDFEYSSGITHLAYNKIVNLKNHLRFGIYDYSFSEEIMGIITANNMNKDYWNQEFSNLYKLALKKLDELIRQHESISFLKAVRVFDPLQLEFISKDLKEYENIFDFSNPKLLKQFKVYLNMKLEEDGQLNPIVFWKNLRNNCPELSELAIKSLNTPVTSVDVERSLSFIQRYIIR